MNFSNMYYNTTQYTYIHTYSNFFHETNLLIRPSVHPPLNNLSIYLPIYLFYTEHIQKEHISHQSKTNIEYLPTYLATERKKE